MPMKQRILLYSLALTSGMLFSAFVDAADSGPVIELHAQVRMASLADPLDEETRIIDSESTQLITALLDHAGLEYEFNLSPWTRIIQLLESRPNVLAYPVARLPDREELYYWIGMMRPIKLSLYGLAKNQHHLPTTLDEARSFQIGVLRDDAIDRYLISQGFENLVRFSNLENSLDMLQRERFDLFPFEAVGIQRILQQNNLSPDLVVPMVPLEAISTESHFVLSLVSDEQLKARLSRAYREMVENGTYEAIMGFKSESRFGR